MFKKTFLLLAAVVLFFSCSSNEEEITPVTNSTETKKTVSTTQKTFKPDGTLEEIIENNIENNKVKTSTFYTKDNVIKYTQTITYDEFGNMKSITEHLPDNTVLATTNYIYDSQNRIKELKSAEKNGTNETITSYSYNSDNTITKTVLSGNKNTIFIYFLNEKGMIYKQTEKNTTGTRVFFAEFDSQNNLLKVTNSFVTDSNTANTNSTATYSYDEINKPKDKMILQNNPNNEILESYDVNSHFNVYNTKYISQINYSSGGIRKIENTFDTAGYIIKRKTYYNNILNSETTYTLN